MTMDVNKDRFNARLARISAGKQWQVEGIISTKQQQQQIEKRSSRKQGLGKGEIIKVPLAFAVGMLAVILGRAYFFYGINDLLASLPEQIPAAIDSVGTMGMSVVFAVLCLMMFGMMRGIRPHALGCGFLLMLYGEGQVMAQAPDLFTRIYSAEYLSERIDTEAK